MTGVSPLVLLAASLAFGGCADAAVLEVRVEFARGAARTSEPTFGLVAVNRCATPLCERVTDFPPRQERWPDAVALPPASLTLNPVSVLSEREADLLVISGACSTPVCSTAADPDGGLTNARYFILRSPFVLGETTRFSTSIDVDAAPAAHEVERTADCAEGVCVLTGAGSG
jgi:hypothetical protein